MADFTLQCNVARSGVGKICAEALHTEAGVSETRQIELRATVSFKAMVSCSQEGPGVKASQ